METKDKLDVKEDGFCDEVAKDIFVKDGKEKLLVNVEALPDIDSVCVLREVVPSQCIDAYGD